MKEEKTISASFIIFGGTGDLTHRKLMPALYNLVYERLLPERFIVIAIGRREKTTEEYRGEVYESLQKYSRNRIDEKRWDRLKRIVHYYRFDFTNFSGYAELNAYLDEKEQDAGTAGNRVFYLAVPPEHFETIVHGIQTNSLFSHTGGWNRLVIEKPFGRDLRTARKLNSKLVEVFREDEIYRIDHYLGKDMIQNIMILRFCNSVFEPLWNSRYIDNIQITISEEQGIGSRAGYFDTSGAMRDMLQNHIVQILSLVAMEPPVSLHTDAVRTEKLKVLKAINGVTPAFLRDNVVFGQYGEGTVDGRRVPGYREEAGVPDTSNTETFVALKLFVNNLRWSGMPFYIRTGKRLGAKYSRIVIQFKSMPDILYFAGDRVQEPNLLVLKIQPDVGVFFQFNTKDLCTYDDIVAVNMDASQICAEQGNTPEAYERLIYDILRGDSTLFSRWDEVEASWVFVDQLIKYRESTAFSFPNYAPGSMGPAKAFEMIDRDSRKWWEI